MPCNIGYRETFQATVAAPQPARFRARGKAANVDRELLDRIGVEDPEFLEWMQDLDVGPLLQVALDRTRQAADTRGLTLSVSPDGFLDIEARAGPDVAAQADRVMARWQFEVLAIVAQILGYEARVTSTPDLTLEAEKQAGEGVRESFRVVKEGGTLRLRFEHFKSRRALEQEVRKVIALARKCGLIIRTSSGDVGPQGTSERQIGDDPLPGLE